MSRYEAMLPDIVIQKYYEIKHQEELDKSKKVYTEVQNTFNDDEMRLSKTMQRLRLKLEKRKK